MRLISRGRFSFQRIKLRTNSHYFASLGVGKAEDGHLQPRYSYFRNVLMGNSYILQVISSAPV